MIKFLGIVIITALFWASTLMAENINSLYGIDYHNAGSSVKPAKITFGHVGGKVGAESEDYRIFFSSRFYDIDGSVYATTYGVEVQYMMNVYKMIDLYIGVNAGYINMMSIDNQDFVIDEDYYYGGDIGLNIHALEYIDFEIGARTLYYSVEYGDTKMTYKSTNIITGYVSMIYKFRMD